MAASTSTMLSRAGHHQQLARPPPPSAPAAAPTPSCRRRLTTTTTVIAAAASKGFAPKKASGGGFGGGTSGSSGAKQQQQQRQPDAASPCPCGSGAAYGACCQPAHSGRAPPDSPEKLLRSRFCGYRLGLVDYLVATTHPEAPERRSAALGLASSAAAGAGAGDAAASREAYRASIARTARSTDFVALAVDKAGADVRAREGGKEEGEEEAFLSFRVWYRSKAGAGRGGGSKGGESVVRETSHFVRGSDTGGKWLYLGEAQETAGEEGARRAAEAEAAAE